MKTFERHKTFSEIAQQCAVLGVPLDSTDYDFGGSTITVGVVGMGHAVYDVNTGLFSGTDDLGLDFKSGDEAHDGHDWFDQLLNFFYVS